MENKVIARKKIRYVTEIEGMRREVQYIDPNAGAGVPKSSNWTSDIGYLVYGYRGSDGPLFIFEKDWRRLGFEIGDNEELILPAIQKDIPKEAKKRRPLPDDYFAKEENKWSQITAQGLPNGMLMQVSLSKQYFIVGDSYNITFYPPDNETAYMNASESKVDMDGILIHHLGNALSFIVFTDSSIVKENSAHIDLGNDDKRIRVLNINAEEIYRRKYGIRK